MDLKEGVFVKLFLQVVQHFFKLGKRKLQSRVQSLSFYLSIYLN